MVSCMAYASFLHCIWIFFSRESDIQTFISKKAKSLLLPFLFWGIINILFNWLNDGNWQVATQAIIGALFRKPTDAGIYCAGALWFLPALFWIEAIYKVLTQLIDNKIIFYVIAGMLGVSGFIAETHGMFLPFALDAALIGIPFMALGDLLRKGRETRVVGELLHMRWYLFCIMIVITTILIFYNGEVNFRGGGYGNYIIACINASLGTILLWNISRVIADRFSKGILKTISEILCSIGRNSIIYLCLNQRIIYFVKPIVSVYFKGSVIKSYLSMGLTLIVVVFICHIIMKVFAGDKRLKCFVAK